MPKSTTSTTHASSKQPESSLSLSSATSTTTNTSSAKRSFLLAIVALGAFFVGRSTQIKWSQSEFYLRGILSSTDLLSENNSTSVLNSYSGLSSDHQHHQRQANNKPFFLQDAPLTLNDKTMRLSPYVDRLWLHNGKILPNDLPAKPTTKLILTQYGWNQPNQTRGLEFPRSLRLREMMQAVIDHPLFDPTFNWTQMVSGQEQFDPTIQYYVFMDVETCFESNYPQYVANFLPNSDKAGGRTVKYPHECPCLDIGGCSTIQEALSTPLFEQIPTARLFFIECRGFGPTATYRQQTQKSPQLSIVSISSEPSQLSAVSDMGHPPPAINPARLDHATRQQILLPDVHDCIQETSQKRPYLLSCVGTVRNDVRRNLMKLHNESLGVILLQPPAFKEEFILKRGITYQQVMRESLFAATPRGDNRFSYRFTEVLSSGAIPVIHSDGWVLPFRRELIDWSKECAVVIPEARVSETIEILRAITPQERCQRRRRCYEIYINYMANAEGTIAGVIESATRTIQQQQKREKQRQQAAAAAAAAASQAQADAAT